MSQVIEALSNPENTVDDGLHLRALVNAASFAWFSYGMMSMTNVIYYVNKFYWEYIIRYDTKVLAFRTWWGIAEYIRVMLNFSTWGLCLMFWAATFVPASETHVLFSYVASVMYWGHLLRVLSVLIIKGLSMAMDSYETEY